MLQPQQVEEVDTSLTLGSMYTRGSHSLRDPCSSSEQVSGEIAKPHETFPTNSIIWEGQGYNDSAEQGEIARPHETFPTNSIIWEGQGHNDSAEQGEIEKPHETFSPGAIIWEGQGYNDSAEQSNIHQVYINKLSLRDVVKRRVSTISQKMHSLPAEHLRELKNELRVILEGTEQSEQRNEFMILQEHVFRKNLKAGTLINAHQVHLEILVAIKTGIQAFVHPNVSIRQTSLIEIFENKRCKNILCQKPLPAIDCICERCINGTGFCNHCMCVNCNEFDIKVNTLRWIGCEMCLHWNHTDCAIRKGQVSMGTCVVAGIISPAEMLFSCGVCNWKSKVYGWVKDVLECCMVDWDKENLIKELNVVGRIFGGSEYQNGRNLYWKCEEIKIKLKTGRVSPSTACNMMLQFFQELDRPCSKQ